MIKKSLAYKFAVFSLIAVALPAVTIAVSLILIGRHTLTESIYTEQSETARRIADRISIHIENVRSVLSIGAAEPGLSVFTRSRQEESLRRLLRWQPVFKKDCPTFKELFILDAAGQETAKLTSQGKKFIPSSKLISRKDRYEFTAPMKKGKAYISEPFLANDHLPYLFISCPTYGRKAVLVGRVSLENLWDLVKEVREGLPGIAYIVDHKGNLIAHPDSDRVQMHTNLKNLPIIKSFSNGKFGRDSFGVYRDERRQKVISLVQPVSALDWGVVMEIPTESAYAPIWKMQKEVIRWTLLCVILILVFAFWRIRKVLKPIKLLDEGASKISQGKWDIQLEISTGDELEHLSQSFQKMAESLKQLEELRCDLISMIVHDLKSPLSGIMGGLDYVIENIGTDKTETTQKVLALTKKSSKNLLAMIQNLLDVAKMEEGKLQLNLEPVSLPELFNECFENFKVQAEKESKLLEKDFPDDLPKISVDLQLIRRVLNNLISNAIRHTSPNGHIITRARPSNGNMEIIVQDDGEGIPAEYHEKIFDKFVQAERKRMHLRSETGLGLTFCKMAIELHGGKISVESEVDKGSAFKFVLPLVQDNIKPQEKSLTSASA